MGKSGKRWDGLPGVGGLFTTSRGHGKSEVKVKDWYSKARQRKGKKSGPSPDQKKCGKLVQ